MAKPLNKKPVDVESKSVSDVETDNTHIDTHDDIESDNSTTDESDNDEPDDNELDDIDVDSMTPVNLDDFEGIDGIVNEKKDVPEQKSDNGMSSSDKRKDVADVLKTKREEKDSDTKKEKTIPANKTSIPAIRKEDIGKTSVVKDIPISVLSAMKAEFPDAANKTDLLMAYLLCHSDGKVAKICGLLATDKQKALALGWEGNITKDLIDEISKMTTTLKNVNHATEVMQMLVSFELYDHLGFTKRAVNSPASIDLREDGVLDILLKAEEQSEGFQVEKRNVLGRPKR